jgi:protein involved in ribonucleotide reduction
VIVYFSSVSGYTHKFVEALGEPAVRLPLNSKEAGEFRVSEEFVLILPTYGASGSGFVPKQVIKFLNQEENRTLLRGVIGSGNRNFHQDFAKAADIVSAKLQVPVLYRFELSGTQEDINIVKEGLHRFGESKFRVTH